MQPKFYWFTCMSCFSVSVMGNKFNFIFQHILRSLNKYIDQQVLNYYPFYLQITRPASLKMLRQYTRRLLFCWFFSLKTICRLNSKRNMKSDLSFNKVLCHIAYLHILLNSLETVLGIIQFTRNFSQLKKTLLCLNICSTTRQITPIKCLL